MSRLPLIGIPADRRLYGKHYFHMVGEKYIEAVAQGANAVPVLVPALGSEIDLPSRCWMHATDCCSRAARRMSNRNTTEDRPAKPGTLHDPNRDATTLPLIPSAVAAGLPVLAICRGFQEMNVAFGGTLNPRLHEVPGNLDHRDDEPRRWTCSTRPPTKCCSSPEGSCEKSPAAIGSRSIPCIRRALRNWARIWPIEARAPDGVIEAFRVADAPVFRAGAAVASGMAICAGPIFERVVCRIRRGQPATRERSKVMYGEHDSAILERTRHFGSRGDHSGHGRRCARQADAGGEICRRGRHAPAGGDFSADGDRGLSGRSERHEPVGNRHRVEGRSEDGARGALGGRAHRAGDSRLFLRRRQPGHHGAALRAAPYARSCTRRRAGSRWWPRSWNSSWSNRTSTPTIR